MKTVRVPDIMSGYAVVSSGESNWRTEVRSILVKKKDCERAYLTHECRAEAVSAGKIFDGRLYEFTVIKTWLGNFNLRSGSYNYGFGKNPPETIYETSNLDVSAECRLRDAVEYDFDEALELLRCGSDGQLFLKVEFCYHGEEYICFSPARYVNYPKGIAEREFFQPISGYTLFFNGTKFLLTYVAAHIERDACNVEFIAKEPTSFFDTKPANSRLRRLVSPFVSFLRTFLRTDEFWNVYRVNGSATIFVYRQ